MGKRSGKRKMARLELRPKWKNGKLIQLRKNKGGCIVPLLINC